MIITGIPLISRFAEYTHLVFVYYLDGRVDGIKQAFHSGSGKVYSVSGIIPLSWYPIFAAEVVAGFRYTDNIMLLPMKTESFNTSIEAAYIYVSSRYDFTDVYCSFGAACLDKANKLIIFLFK